MSKKTAPSKKKVQKTSYSRNDMLKAQDEFYKKHPNARPLLTAFIILALLLGFLYYVKFGFALMY